MATRLRILGTAEEAFTKRGYAGTSIDELLKELALTKGALYHHFPSKRALFDSTAKQVAERTARAILQAVSAANDPYRRLHACCRAYLNAGLEAGVRQVLLRDAPAVLGWEAWRAQGTPEGLDFLEGLVAKAIEAKLLIRLPPRAAAHGLLGAINELNMSIAARDDSDAAHRDATRALDAILNGLRS